MSHSRWTRIFAKGFSAVCLGLTLSTAVWSAPRGIPATSVGPTSEEEGKLLHDEGRAAYEAGRCEEAIPKLERYIARYPGLPDYTEARLWLGRCFLKLGRPHKAKPWLKEYILASGRSTQAIAARIELAQVQLELDQDSEALLTSEEIIRVTPKSDAETQARGLLLKTEALLGLKQESRATATLGSARQALPQTPPASLVGGIESAQLALKLRACAKFPSPGRLDEGQTRDQLERRGTCLMDALLTFRKTLETGDVPSSQASTQQLIQAYGEFNQACAHPPKPPKVGKKERSKPQLQAYFHELGLILQQDCRNKIQQSQQLIQTWSPSTPASTSESLKKAAAELEQLSRKT